MLTRKNKKMMGGAAQAPDPYSVSKFNIHFVKFFNFYATNHLTTSYSTYDKITNSFTGKGIYIGFYEELRKITFGSVLDFAKTTKQKSLPDDPLYYITITPESTIVVNKFKLYIMSVMANYNMDGQKSLYDRLQAPINTYSNDPNVIMKELNMELVKAPPKPVNAPPDPVNALGPSQSDDDILELNIYKEFGVKCTLDGGECHGKIKDDFIIKNNLTKHTKIEGYIRDLYVNVFDYITGSEIPIKLVTNRTQAIQKSITNIEKAISYIYKQMKKSPTFIGARTELRLEFNTLLKIFNLIRKDVNKSIFNETIQIKLLDERVPVVTLSE